MQESTPSTTTTEHTPLLFQQKHTFYSPQPSNIPSSPLDSVSSLSLFNDDDDDDFDSSDEALRDENGEPTSRFIYWMDSMTRRFVTLTLLPTLFVLAWCAIPFPVVYDKYRPSNQYNGLLHPKTNFWFFLLYYYGTFNAVSILLITHIFRLYSLDWYPRSVSGPVAVLGVWITSEAIGGGIIYFLLDPTLRTRILTWVVVTLVTMSFPLLAAWWKIRRKQRHWVRRSLTVAQKLFAPPDSNRAWIRRSLSHPRRPAPASAIESETVDGPSIHGPDSDEQSPEKKKFVLFSDSDDPSPQKKKFAPVFCTRSVSSSSTNSSDSSATVVPSLLSTPLVDPYTLTLTLSPMHHQHHNNYTPSSYTRFLWFVTAITVSLASLLLSQLYAHIFLSTLPHSAFTNLVYIWGLTITNAILSTLCVTITESKIQSPPLSLVFRLYFAMIYFVFYRTLFARLRSVDQFLWIQLASSVGVVILYPALMSRTVWRIMTFLQLGGGSEYGQWKRDVGRGFWIRNVAENATMMAFLGTSTLLHFLPQAPFYPFFKYTEKPSPDDPYTYELTLKCTLGIWASELISSYLARLIFKRYYGLSITRQASREVKRSPEVVGVMGLIIVFVGMGMVLACCRVQFG